MVNMVGSFKELTPELQPLAGGKGGMLASMFQHGYPVPEGIVVLPPAFEGGKLNNQAWNSIQSYLNTIRKNHEHALFGVRSSALSEDSAQASFAGEFESVLNVETDEDVLTAIYTVRRSIHSERVKVYSTVQGVEQSHQMAVVIQLMVQSEIAGVLFTADPITGSRINMTGNFVYGLGEQLASGETNAYPFKFKRPAGKYDGPSELRKYSSKLYKLADRLDRELAGPQDIEWAVAKGNLYILQARPITTLKPGNPDTYEWNDSLTGDFLWVNTNIREAIPDVFTPLTWTMVRSLDNEIATVPGYYLTSGNIYGRAYTNISLRLSVLAAFGVSVKRGLNLISDVFGLMPEGVSVPVFPFSRLELIKVILPKAVPYVQKLLKASKNIKQYLDNAPDLCRKMEERIKEVNTREELLSLWKDELRPYNSKAFFALLAGGAKTVITLRLNREITRLVGTEDASALLSNCRGNSGLASLGPVVGIARVAKGEISRDEYLLQYGHRGPHEFELSIPGPAEDAGWLEAPIRDFTKADTDVSELLRKQYAQYEGAWRRFKERFPDKAGRMEKQIAKAAGSARLREAARSEFIRVFRLVRAFALKAGDLSGLGDGVFFLYLDEVLSLLSGDDSATKHIPARKDTYNKYRSLPPFPSIIRGRFDPFQWANDPNRRIDYYDSTMPVTVPDSSETLQGFAGAAGRVEGRVRVLTGMEQGGELQPGEILVAATTNVGWTPLFPRAAAIITDIGAPLSHAAIVARELGIPAVVGCGNATVRLKTGDTVMVDGGQGVVRILNQIEPPMI